jgi:RNA polymerase sigma-70 factor (ECF subfamily)
MIEEPDFHDLLRRLRSGEREAYAALVERYGSILRMVVRARLTDPGLRRVFDSVDICQSVFLNFYLRITAGEFDLESPKQLLSLLATMARNSLSNQAKRQHADKRDLCRLDQEAAPETVLVDPGPSPSSIVAGKELLEKVRARFSHEERWLAEQRSLGRNWADIASELGETPDMLRMRLTRAMDRIGHELGIA